MTARLAAAAAVLCLGPAAALAQDAPAGYEPGIFQLSITDLPRTSIPMLITPDGGLLFPIAPILRHAGVPFLADSAGLTIDLVDAGRRALPARIDTIMPAVWRGRTHLPAQPGEIIGADGELYISVRLLSYLLNADMRADFSTLDLRLDPTAPVPAQIAMATQRRRQLAVIRAGGRRAPLPPTGLEPHSGAGVLHYSISTAAPDARQGTVLSLESGVALLGGLAAVGYTGSPGGNVPDPRLRFRYERFIPEQPLISFVRAGDVLAEGAFLRAIRGVTVTNRPLRREGFFQDIVIDPEVPAGYEIEVYQGGQLIAFSDGGAQEPLRVPVTYGRTDLEVRMIAPSGEVVTTDLLYGVPQTQLPERAMEYSAGAGFCHLQDCELAFASADYGVRRWLTVGAGFEADRDSTGVEHLPFARAILSPVGGWLGQASFIAGRQFTGTAQYNGSGPVTGSLGLDVRTTEVPRATLLPQSATRWDMRGEVGYRRQRLLARFGGIEGGGVDRWGLGWVASIPGGIALAQLESFPARATELSVSGFRLLRARLLGATTTMSTRLTVSTERVRGIELGASGGWGNDFFASATLGWDADASATLTLSFSRIFPIGQLAGVLSASSGRSRGSVRADGAIAFDPPRAVLPAAYSGIGFAGLDVVVFRDANGNGVLDEGEQPAQGVVVQAGQRTAISDSTGHARIWGLLPWEKTAVTASPDGAGGQWAPASARTVIRPVPHVFNPVRVPLVATRELIAYVLPNEDIPSTGGIGYRLISESTGRVQEGLTLSDGSIYVSGVPVGDYLLELDADALEFLDATVVGAPLRFTIPAEGGDQYVFEMPPIELRSGRTSR